MTVVETRYCRTSAKGSERLGVVFIEETSAGLRGS